MTMRKRFLVFPTRHDHSLMPSNSMLLQLLSLDVKIINLKKKEKGFSSFNAIYIFED